MFGYVQYDKPYLYIKDFELYRAMYCGVCKGIGETCGQVARLGLSYDAAFLSALLHNLKGVDVTVEKQACVKKLGARKPMAAVDELTKAVSCLNTVLLYYKLSDDVADEKKGGFKRKVFSRAFRRAKKLHPRIVEIVDGNMRLHSEREKAGCDSLDIAADATANMMAELSDYFLEEKATDETRGLFYDIGKWIYLIDAADDYDKDVKKGNYNPFYLAYGEADKQSLLEKHGEELRFLFNTLFFDMREKMSGIQFCFNRDLTDNVLLRGLPLKTETVVFRAPCPKTDKKTEAKIKEKGKKETMENE